MSDFSLQCAFRRNKQRTNVPLARFTPISPYTNPNTGVSTGLTQEALNMRRKAEILKYESNRMPTQTNNLTQKQKWSRLVNASGKSARLLDPTTVICPGETVVRRPNPIPTTSSGIPGPVMYLYEDPDVPLYNYIINRTYAFNVPNESSFWDTTVYTNVGVYDRAPEKVFTLSIKQNINTDRATYRLDIPLGIHAQGTHRTNAFSGNKIRLSVSSATLDVYCNSVKQTALSRTVALPPYIVDITPTNNVVGASFIATKYIGNLQFNNIVLETSPVYVFDFTLTLTITETILTTSGNAPTYTPDYPRQSPSFYYFGVSYSLEDLNSDPTLLFDQLLNTTFRTYGYANIISETLPEQSVGCIIGVSPFPTPALVRPALNGYA